MNAAAYKQQKEAFVSSLHGTSIAELLLLVCPLPAGNVNMTLCDALNTCCSSAGIARRINEHTLQAMSKLHKHSGFCSDSKGKLHDLRKLAFSL
jgi:hypothetical protein